MGEVVEERQPDDRLRVGFQLVDPAANGVIHTIDRVLVPAD